MLKYFVTRVLTLIPMVILISAVIFFALELTPGDPITRTLSPEILSSLTEERLEEVKEAYGLSGPAYIRYFKWLGRVLTGDMGVSVLSGQPVSGILANLVPYTLQLSFAALIISTILGLIFGIIAAIKQNTWVDYVSSVIGILGISFPEFFIGICMIQIFAIKLGWFPSGGRTDIGLNFWGSLKYMVLPALSLGFSLMSALMRYSRGAMLDVLSKDYVKTARAKGLPEWKVYFKHAFRNALMPISVLVCLRLPTLIGGSVLIEQVFRWPGVGQKLMSSITAKDYSIVMMITFIMSIITLLASVLIDLLTAILDPRVRLD